MKKGFTMVELLIVLAIMGILSAAIFMSIFKMGVSNELKLAGRQLASAISQTQTYALTGKTKAGFYPCSFKFSTETGENGFYYRIQYIPRKINEECGEEGKGWKDFEGPIKFEKVESMTLGSVVFTVPHAKYLAANSDKTEFVLKKKNQEYKVIVYSSGLIQEGGEVDE